MRAGLARKMLDRGYVIRRTIIVDRALDDEVEAIASHLHVLELALAQISPRDGLAVHTPAALRTFVAEIGERVAALIAEPVEDDDKVKEAVE